MGRIRDFVRLYILNRDLQETEREVLMVLADGKEREAHAYGRVANRTGDFEARVRSKDAERKARELRQELADDVAIDVLRQG